MDALSALNPEPPPTAKQKLSNPRTYAAVGAAALIAALGAAAGWVWWLKPQRAAAQKRYDTIVDVSTLFALELTYKQAHGTFAGDIDSLLASTPDREGFKKRMAEHLDMSTLAVVGDAQKFKIEANVLDAERTLIKVKGPIQDRAPAAAPKTPDLAPPSNADGAPIETGR